MKTYKDILASPISTEVVERLCRYARLDTQSDHHVEAIPSTPGQWDLARLLEKELRELGLRELELDEHCYLIARLPASPGLEKAPAIGFMAHMDTASEVDGAAKPRVIQGYDGSTVELGSGYSMSPKDHPALAKHVGDTIVVTDGSTLLGADDKAGLAEIMTALHWLIAHPELRHGPIEIAFTPDEETGKGMNLFPARKLKAVACYTLDGEELGPVEAECFTAYTVNAEFTGKPIHPGIGRGKLVNATAMAASFVTMLPRSESPEATDGWYGYYNAHEISGGVEKARVEVLLRDFDDGGMARRIEAVKAFAKAVEAQFPGGVVELDIKKAYLNMRRKLDESPQVLERALEAARRAGVEPWVKPIRGGTDGSRLTEMGIPTPNLFAGYYNYHSRFEWASAAEMTLTVQTIVELAKLWAEA